jgi:hypothetical protein
LFDRNRDGSLQEAELAALRTYLEKRALGTFHAELDGRPLVLTRTPCSSCGSESTAENEASACLEAELDSSKAHNLTLEDGGDSEGHVPVMTKPSQVRAPADLPRGELNADLIWVKELGVLVNDLPAHKRTTFVIVPR